MGPVLLNYGPVLDPVLLNYGPVLDPVLLNYGPPTCLITSVSQKRHSLPTAVQTGLKLVR